MSRVALILLFGASAGCNVVFGLDRAVPDAAPDTAPDTTLDSVTDAPLDAMPLPPGLVARYPLDTLMGNTTSEVVSGGVLQCPVSSCPTVIPGVVDTAMAFGGPMTLLQAPGTPAIATTAAFTVTAWLRIGQPLAARGCPINKLFGTGTFNSWQLCVDPNAYIMFTSNQVVQFTGSFPVESWQHVALRWTGTTGSIAVNGVERVSAPLTGVAFDDAPIVLGADIDNGARNVPWIGWIDDVRVYSRALSAAEISALAVAP